MHFLKNIFANSLGQTYLILSSLIATPFFLQILGDEAFGIIGFYIILMTWMNFLDIGFTPAFGRLIAYEKDKTDSDKKVASVFKSDQKILFLSLLVITISIFQSKNISQEWINSVSLSNDLIDDSIKIMFLIIALRWFRVLYISGINGLEDQVWLSSANAIFATLRNFAIIPLLIIFPNIIFFYFIYQLILIFIELVIFRIRLTKIFLFQKNTQFFILTGIILKQYCHLQHQAPMVLSFSLE